MTQITQINTDYKMGNPNSGKLKQGALKEEKIGRKFRELAQIMRQIIMTQITQINTD